MEAEERCKPFCAKFLSDQEKANYQQKPVKDKSNDGDMERDDIAEDHSQTGYASYRHLTGDQKEEHGG